MIDSIKRFATAVGRPAERLERVSIRSVHLPRDLIEMLQVVNGFILGDGYFRFFGVGSELPANDLIAWNNCEWIDAYGSLSRGLLFFAEDVFGDQYAYEMSRDNDDPLIVKFHCEGGGREPLPSESLNDWLQDDVLKQRPTCLDFDLANAAIEIGLQPSISEHLGFEIPLVIGGEGVLQNLEVIDRNFHLGLLGQLSLENSRQPDGAIISRFRG